MGYTLIDLFNKGGLLMWPLLLCSILAAAAIIERSVFFLRIRQNFRRFVADLVALVANRRLQAAKDFLRNRPDPASVISGAMLANLDLSASLRQEVMQRVGDEQVTRLNARVGLLSTLAHLSPLLGLFGTVTGMIRAFRQIEALGGLADVAALAGGIWEALLTTAFGLTIGVPAAAAYHYFENLAARRASEMQSIVSILNETLGIEPGDLEVAGRPVQTVGEPDDAQI
ncbi:MAG: MotA/TolQ/ExbB proton channel family protein [Planctomycetota bacterium]